MKTAIEILEKTISLSPKDIMFIHDKIREVQRMPMHDEQELLFESFTAMMFGLFNWGDTKQGHDYWSNVVKREEEMKESLENYAHE